MRPGRLRVSCSRCDRPARAGQVYCMTHHAEYMRGWRRGRGGHGGLSEEQKRRSNARAYANVYQRRGRLKPQPCEVCGSANVTKHHNDYSKPLAVRWLCKDHHLDVHYGPGRPQRAVQLGLFTEAA